MAFLPTATARLIYARLGRQIQQACEGTGVQPAFLAALISLENAPLRAGAGRFEPKVFRALRLVRLGLPRLTKRGLVRDYNGITRQDLTGLTLPNCVCWPRAGVTPRSGAGGRSPSNAASPTCNPPLRTSLSP